MLDLYVCFGYGYGGIVGWFDFEGLEVLGS